MNHRKLRYKRKVKDVIANADRYHRAYYKVKTFGGPSLHFHRRSLEGQTRPFSDDTLENIYATLTAWGMHRMGKKGSKMLEFEDFRASVVALRAKIRRAQKIRLPSITESDWKNLEFIFRNIRIMASRTMLVGNSKVMAHLLPNIVPPIDREYTLKFLHGNTYVPQSKEGQWRFMKDIISEFFMPVSQNKQFVAIADQWLRRSAEYRWDTSVSKLIDNLVIGAMKTSGKTTNGREPLK